MNKIRFTLLAALLITVSIFGQSPEQISYQAVVRDAANAIVANQLVGMKISVLQTTENGTAVYEETQTPTTNANGLLSIYIGAGTTDVVGIFSDIVWSTGSYFVKIEIDPAGGTNYTIIGTTQLVSVPYALYAKATAAGALTGTALNATVIGSSLTSVGTLTDLTVTGTSETGLVKITGGSPAVGKVLTSDADGLASWQAAAATVREVADEFSSTANQTAFTLSQAPSANSKVKMYVNGIRISNTSYTYTSSVTSLTYIPANNEGYALTAGDRIQFDYFY
ncbi:hypothetical protein BTO04_12755 [Polaribacter sp. SA4-10]|uniref:hypothetical protein n=1 Tax=Polaribacter sp. SA4-10 TaxID=754397 RepID=UPI000B3C3D9F|nr:hypothetical protein [Polaribacter sp. SA4-10]ARV07505.1 hypothetical protein BTO04_12755 [Polaribacter sp. SA4-10]